MEIGVQRTDSQRSQNKETGPRVSFNKDVHVKRIGSRTPPENLYFANHSNVHQSNLRREIPKDLTDEQIRKEAALVLAQAESVKCRAEGAENISGGGRLNEKYRNGGIKRYDIKNNGNKFNSLPTRKKKSKPVERSASDASNSAKKVKKPILFNLFSRKSDTQLDQITKPNNNNNSNSKTRKPQKLNRSKSDVGLQKGTNETRRKRNNSENEENEINVKKKTQLSPIIEVTQREDYFSEPQRTDIRENTKISNFENIGFVHQKDLDLVPSKSTIETQSHNTKATVPVNRSLSKDEMHSSQVPASKPPLTKGLTVDNMVKRLSLERFSPPPHFSGPAFSYTRSPTEQNIIYAQVVCDENGKSKQTVHSSNFLSKDPMGKNSSQKYMNGDEVDSKRTTNKTTIQREYPSQDNFKTKIIIEPQKSYMRTTKEPFRSNSDEDEGLGYEIKRSIEDDHIPVKEISDDPIRPNYRNVPPEKPIVFDMPNRGRADGMDSFFPEFQELSARRKILESRIQQRRLGSREILDEPSPEREFYKMKASQNSPPVNNNIRMSYSPAPHLRRSQSPVPLHRRSHSPANCERASQSPVPHHRRPSYSPERVVNNDEDKKFHKLNLREIHSRYSPQRTHLDMVSSPPSQTVSTKIVKETKYYHNGQNGVKETYSSETKLGENGRPYTTEHRTRERIGGSPKEIDLGYIEDHRDFKYGHMEPDSKYFQNKYRTENEPRSLDSQLSDMRQDSPDRYNNNNRSKVLTTNRNVMEAESRHYKSNPDLLEPKYPHQVDYENTTLKRQKKHQRSFDKGDSGIENDYRKDSFNGEFQSRWRHRTYLDDIKSSDLFLKKERKHTEDLYLTPRRFININYRERSIDDGSHYDPNLDKFENSSRSRSRTQSRSKSVERSASIKNEKKISGLEKVKQLLTGGTLKKKSSNTTTIINNKSKKTPEKEMVKEEEVRARYNEYRATDSAPSLPLTSASGIESKNFDISTRRRLSTPKASPVPKRTSSQKSSRSSSDSKAEKLGWFKSIDRLSRKKNKKVESVPEDDSSSFRSKGKKSTTTTHSIKSNFAHSTPSKNLRFFGDTDLESNPSISKSASKTKSRHPVGSSSNLSTQSQKKFSKSAYELDSLSKSSKVDRNKSSSLHNLDKAKTLTRNVRTEREPLHSRQLQNIEESHSASDGENERESHRHNRRRTMTDTYRESSPAPRVVELNHLDYRIHSSKSKSNSPETASNHELPFEVKRHMFEESYRSNADHNNRSMSRDRSPAAIERNIRYGSEDRTLRRSEGNKPPPGPPKPARTIDRHRRGESRDRDRLPDSSGTEGESSQMSQRSVVYLHATTVGEIPQPYVVTTRRKAASRDDLSAPRSKSLTPQTRTVSRSVSMLAPWKPKHLRDGYEINYSQQNNEKLKNYDNSSRYDSSDSRRSSTLTRPRKESSIQSSTLTRNRKSHSRDELSSDKSSSIKDGGRSVPISRSKLDYRHNPSQSRDTIDYRTETLNRSHNKENKIRSDRPRY